MCSRGDWTSYLPGRGLSVNKKADGLGRVPLPSPQVRRVDVIICGSGGTRSRDPHQFKDLKF
ncbi:hypothetical protein EJ110_NYTH23694 [Nymphaea thermarum]|nr:hypothetical protein EJ110_NYTH23694 [Nymphaea thermarum]